MSEIVLTVTTASEAQLPALLKLSEAIADIPGDILEIGAWKCGTTIQLANKNSQKMVYAFDLFGGLPYPHETDFSNFGDVDFDEVCKLCAHLPNIRLVRGMHEETIPLFAKYQRPVSMLFLDSDWYSSHVVALKYLAPLVVENGIIVFHDWSFEGVQKAAFECLTHENYQNVDGEYDYNPPKQWLKVLQKCRS